MKSADNKPATADGLIVRATEPLNLEMPFSTLSGFTTPNESFYVRCHFPIPEIAAAEWRLKVEGEVEAPFEIDYEELLTLESRTISPSGCSELSSPDFTDQRGFFGERGREKGRGKFSCYFSTGNLAAFQA